MSERYVSYLVRILQGEDIAVVAADVPIRRGVYVPASDKNTGRSYDSNKWYETIHQQED